MEGFRQQIISDTNELIVNATVTVYDNLDALATIYDENGSSIGNPITADSTGYYEFFAANGEYKIKIEDGSRLIRWVYGVILDDFNEGAEWVDQRAATYASTTTFTLVGDQTTAWHIGRRVKVVGVTTGTVYGTITNSAFSTVTTVTVDFDSGTLNNESLTAWIGILSADNQAVDASAVTYTQGGTGSETRSVESRLQDRVSVFDFIPESLHAAIKAGTNTTDLQSYIQAASDTGKNIDFPEGTFRVESTVTFANNAAGARQHVRGAGKNKTIISFVPSATDTCFEFVPNGVTNIDEDQVPSANTFLYQCGLEGFTFTGGNAQVKTAVKLVNFSEFILSDIATTSWAGTRSIGIHTKGSAFLSARDLSINCDLPILIDVGATYGVSTDISADHFNFHNIYLIADNYPCILGNGYGYWTNVSFTGHQSWVKGTHGIHVTQTGFTSTGNTGTDGTVTIENLRTEQGQLATAYSINFEQIGHLVVNGAYLDSTREGFYVRGRNTSSRCLINGGAYIGGSGRTALDVNDTIRELHWNNFFWQSSSTKTLTNLRERFALKARDEDYATTAIYAVDRTIGDYHVGSNSTQINEADYFTWKGTLAASATKTINISGAAKPHLLVTLSAFDATANVNAGGQVIDYSTTDTGSVPQIVGGTTGTFSIGNVAGDLCYDRAAGNTTQFTIRNNLANSAEVVCLVRKI